MKKIAVLMAVLVAAAVAGDGDIYTIEVHGGLMKNKQVREEVAQIAKAGNINKVDFKKMQEKDCSLIVYPLDGSDFRHGAYWQDEKTCKWHYETIVPTSRARGYGIYNGSWMRIKKGMEYADTKLIIKRSNKCYFLPKEEKPGDGNFKRSEWKVVGPNTVEIHFGLYADKGVFLGLGADDPKKSDYEEHKDMWNVFDSPLDCSDVPSREEWTVKQKVGGRWVVTGRATFYLEP